MRAIVSIDISREITLEIRPDENRIIHTRKGPKTDANDATIPYRVIETAIALDDETLFDLGSAITKVRLSRNSPRTAK